MIDVHQIEQLIQQDDETVLRDTISSLGSYEPQEINERLTVCAQAAIDFKKGGYFTIILEALESHSQKTDKDWWNSDSNSHWQQKIFTMVNNVEMFDVMLNWMGDKSKLHDLMESHSRRMYPFVIQHLVPQKRNRKFRPHPFGWSCILRP